MSPADPTAQLNARQGHGLAAALVAAGVRDVVLSPGSRSTPLVLGFADELAVRRHVLIDERAAGFVALGLARASERPVVLVCTSGSAGAHWLPAVIEAFHSHVPLILMTADRPPELHDVGAPQSVAQTRLFGDFVRWSQDLGTPDASQSDRWLRSVATRAVVQATRGPAGPVHLNLPFRQPLWSAEVDVPRFELPAVQWVNSTRRAEAQLVAALAEQFTSRARGIIVCGSLPPTLGAQLAEPLARLAARLGWPILAEPTSQLRFGEHDRSTLICSSDALLRDEDFAELFAPALVLRFGQAPLSKAVRAWLSQQAVDRTVLVDAHSQWHDPDLVAGTLLGVDPVSLCRDLAEVVAVEPVDPAWLASWRRADEAATVVVDAACAEGFWEGTVARQVVRHLPPESALHVAASMPIRDLDSFGASGDLPRLIFANRGANGIDGLVATAAGEALALGQPLTLLIGDLALQHDMGGLAAAAALGVRLTVVVINNGGGHIFDHLPIARHPTALTPYFVTPQAMDFQALATACGAAGSRVHGSGDLVEALTAAAERSGVTLIEAMIEPADNLAQHHAVWRAVQCTLKQFLEVAA